jgi:hypothetical protein
MITKNKKKMDKKLGIILLVFGLIAVIVWVSMIYFDEENKIKSEIEKANYCETKSDCVDVGGKCPFGCYVFVNENEAERIGNLIENYESTCIYSCVALENYDCVENKCVVNFEQ